jgi:hypothetical protein
MDPVLLVNSFPGMLLSSFGARKIEVLKCFLTPHIKVTATCSAYFSRYVS